jgi:serine/threonine protein kinase
LLRSFTGVVIFKGTFEDNSYIFIVQEDCKKGDLFKRVLRAGGILPERVVVTEVSPGA